MSGKPDVFMTLYLGDFMKHVGRLPRAEIGSYMLLMIDYWINGALPDDDEMLAAAAKCSADEWRRCRPRLEPFFTIADGLWKQKRVEEELEKARTRTRKASENAIKRWHGDASSIADSIHSASPEHMLEPCSSQSQPEDSRPPPAPAAPRADVVDLFRRQLEEAQAAAGDAMASPAICPGMASIAPLRACLAGDSPCDWAEDVIPAVRSAAAWHRGHGGVGSMKSWTAAVRIAAENRDKRLAGAPPSESNGHGQSPASTKLSARRAKLDRAFAGSEAAMRARTEH